MARWRSGSWVATPVGQARHADGVLFRQRNFLQPLTRGQVAGHDVLENLLGQKFGKRFDGFAEGNRRLGGGWAHSRTLSQFIRLTIVR